MLVGRRMKDEVWTSLTKYFGHPFRDRDIADDRKNTDSGKCRTQLQQQRMKGVFIALKQHQGLRPIGGDLAAQLRPDRSSRPRDQYRLPFDQRM